MENPFKSLSGSGPIQYLVLLVLNLAEPGLGYWDIKLSKLILDRSISALHLLTPIKSNAVRGAECKMMVSQLSISSLQNTQGAAPRLRPSILLETFTINLIH